MCAPGALGYDRPCCRCFKPLTGLALLNLSDYFPEWFDKDHLPFLVIAHSLLELKLVGRIIVLDKSFVSGFAFDSLRIFTVKASFKHLGQAANLSSK